MNNAAILPDGTLLFSPTLEGLRTMVSAATGSLDAGRAARRSLANSHARSDIISAYLIPGDTLRATPTDILGEPGTPEQIAAIEDMMAEVDAGVLEPMPRPRLAAIGSPPADHCRNCRMSRWPPRCQKHRSPTT